MLVKFAPFWGLKMHGSYSDDSLDRRLTVG